MNSLNLSSLFGQDDYILASFFLLFFCPFCQRGLRDCGIIMWGVELHCKLEHMVQNETREHITRMKSAPRFCGDLRYNTFVLNQSYGFPCYLDAWDTTDCHHVKK